jgi:hypothetical protein
MSYEDEGGVFTCCICDTETKGWGNNAYPVRDNHGEYFEDHDHCCDECNAQVVVPERLKEIGL